MITGVAIVVEGLVDPKGQLNWVLGFWEPFLLVLGSGKQVLG